MHNTMVLLKQINKTKFLIPYEQLYIHSHHHHKQLIPEQNRGEYNPMYQLVYDQQVTPHPTEPPDLYPHPQSPIIQSTENCNQPTAKSARDSHQNLSVVPPEDGLLTPETYRGL
jgi:hypothetical protein